MTPESRDYRRGPLVKLGEQGGFDLLHPCSYELFASGDLPGDLVGNPLLVVVGQHGAIVLRRQVHGVCPEKIDLLPVPNHPNPGYR